GVPEVEWKQSKALLLSIKSFNDLEFINLYQSEKEARELMDIGTSSMMIFDAPELYRGDADLSKINLEQDLRVLEASSNDDQDTKTLPLEALSIKNGEYGKIYINPDLKDNGVDYNSTKLYAELIEDDSDYEITLPITRNRQTFEQWKSEEGFVGVYLDTDCTSIKDDEACPLNIAITGIDHPLVGALLVAENSSMQMRIPVFINTDISLERTISYYEKRFKPGVSVDDFFDPFTFDDSYYDYYEQRPFYIGIKNMSHQEVDDVSLLFSEEARNKEQLQHLRVIGSGEIDQVMSEFNQYFKDMGIQKSDVCLDGVIPPGGCKLIIMGGNTVPLGTYEFDFMI
ncbi:hypothetical protein, partial [Facilibium subflavum]|uniref:hypothetical protein n=1 Tax=Facilibium subflavum TaxID=2219058 RepID=UPI0013C2B413